jgi:hypothetical protein
MQNRTSSSSSHHTVLPPGDYMIINKLTGQCLDGDIKSAKQYSNRHQRCFVNSYVNVCNETQKWTVSIIAPKDKKTPELYMLSRWDLCLDGNYNYIPQFQQTVPSPYLWPKRLDAPPGNHLWALLTVDRMPNTFHIMNYSNKRVLDGYVESVNQYDQNHKSPFLSTYSVGKVQMNQCWEFIPWPKDQIYSLIRNGYYIIQNRKTGNYMNYSSSGRIQTLQPEECNGVSHIWAISCVESAFNEYTIEHVERLFLEDPDYLSIQTVKDLKPSIRSIHPMMTMASQFRWKLLKTTHYEQDGSLYIINTATGMCLDGGTYPSVSAKDVSPPFFARFHLSDVDNLQSMWHFIPVDRYGTVDCSIITE